MWVLFDEEWEKHLSSFIIHSTIHYLFNIGISSDDPSYDLVSVMTFVSPVSSDINSYTCTCVNEYLEKEYTSKVITELLIGERIVGLLAPG